MAWFKRSQPELKMIGGGGEKIQADDLPDLAALMNMSIEDLKDEFYLFQIRKFMSRLGKVAVRYNLTENEGEKLYVNSARLALNQLLVAPAYVDNCLKYAEKHENENVPLGVIIDFPFGESTFSGKLLSVKECARKDISEVSVVIPPMYAEPEKARELKKQLKKLGRIRYCPVGAAFNAQDMTEEQLKRAVKTAEKTKIAFITLFFGETDDALIKSRTEMVLKNVSGKKINVFGNINNAAICTELLKLDTGTIFTPFADEIGAELLKKFKIKSLKLM